MQSTLLEEELLSFETGLKSYLLNLATDIRSFAGYFSDKLLMSSQTLLNKSCYREVPDEVIDHQATLLDWATKAYEAAVRTKKQFLVPPS